MAIGRHAGPTSTAGVERLPRIHYGVTAGSQNHALLCWILMGPLVVPEHTCSPLRMCPDQVCALSEGTRRHFASHPHVWFGGTHGLQMRVLAISQVA